MLSENGFRRALKNKKDIRTDHAGIVITGKEKTDNESVNLADMCALDAIDSIIEHIESHTSSINELVKLHEGEDKKFNHPYWTYPIIAAILKNNTGCVDYLISKGAHLNVYDKEFESPIHAAIKTQSKEMIELIVRHKDTNLLETDGVLFNPLQIFFKELDESLDFENKLKLFIDNRLMHFIIDTYKFHSILIDVMSVVRKHPKEIMHVLSTLKVDMNRQNKDGLTPLMYARKNNLESYIQILDSTNDEKIL
jgi:ankyrin repeat protein